MPVLPSSRVAVGALALAPTILALAEDKKLVAELVGNDDYLEKTWAECRQALAQSDPRETWGLPSFDVDVVGELDLLDDLEIDLDVDFDVEIEELPPQEVDSSAARQRFSAHRMCAEYLAVYERLAARAEAAGNVV